MYTSFHTAISILTQKAFPGLLGILLSLPGHYVADNLNEATIYNTPKEAFVIEVTLNLDMLLNTLQIEDKQTRENYLLSMLIGNLPDIGTRLIGQHLDVPLLFEIDRDIGIAVNVGSVLIANKIIESEILK